MHNLIFVFMNVLSRDLWENTNRRKSSRTRRRREEQEDGDAMKLSFCEELICQMEGADFMTDYIKGLCLDEHIQG